MSYSQTQSSGFNPSQPKGARRVCVLGGGCIGLSNAVVLSRRLKERGQSSSVSITIVAENFPPATTSNAAAGLWRVFSVMGVDQKTLDRWAESTQRWLEEQMRTSDGADHGIFPTFIVEGADASSGNPPDWLRRMNGFRMLTEAEKSLFGLRAPVAWQWLSLIVESGRYMVWLKELCMKGSIRFEQRKVESMDDLAEYDYVLNCTGLAAHKLFNDSAVVPVRGQIMRVKAPWIKHITLSTTDNTYTYIIPNRDFVVLGGVAQEGNWSTEVSASDSAGIWERCCKTIPSLRSAEVLEEVVGLRPCRKTGVRIELDSARLSDGRALPIVHNYGHGGSGFTIHWGCAEDAVDLLLPVLDLPPALSKL